MVNLTTDYRIFLIPSSKAFPPADISLLLKQKPIRISCSTLNIKLTSHNDYNHITLEVAIQYNLPGFSYMIPITINKICA